VPAAAEWRVKVIAQRQSATGWPVPSLLVIKRFHQRDAEVSIQRTANTEAKSFI